MTDHLTLWFILVYHTQKEEAVSSLYLKAFSYRLQDVLGLERLVRQGRKKVWVRGIYDGLEDDCR